MTIPSTNNCQEKDPNLIIIRDVRERLYRSRINKGNCPYEDELLTPVVRKIIENINNHLILTKAETNHVYAFRRYCCAKFLGLTTDQWDALPLEDQKEQIEMAGFKRHIEQAKIIMLEHYLKDNPSRTKRYWNSGRLNFSFSTSSYSMAGARTAASSSSAPIESITKPMETGAPAGKIPKVPGAVLAKSKPF